MADPRCPRWEWSLPNGGRVVATIERDGMESVTLDGQVVSRTARGGKPEGHALSSARDDEAVQATVTFDPRQVICVLRTEGLEIAPDVWPVPEKRERAPAPSVIPVLPIALAGIGLVIAVALGTWWGFRDRPTTSGATQPHRAASGLFVAHVPSTFAARPLALPNGLGGTVFEEKATGAVIMWIAMPDAPADRWAVHQRIHGEALAVIPRGGSSFEERSRRDDRCAGQEGAVVVASVLNARSEKAKLWSCAFTHRDAGYLVMIEVKEGDGPAAIAEEARLRRIVDDTELTHLGEMRAE